MALIFISIIATIIVSSAIEEAVTGLDIKPVNPLQIPVPPRRREHALFRSSNFCDIFYYGIVVGTNSFCNFAASIDTYGGDDFGHDCNK
ncbi:hypothetical protein BDA99DRAFT_561605 [Phascolomyces articulosus]|uniref:Uncharacterized protein n=1 Tax=Phascolomyces articulosus TaxID=60185 RepID=A0AAD5JX60_9FUNG|nr:hypothetical protein BDA99DRAFT_561605 [Phascolomyces articulosus]